LTGVSAPKIRDKMIAYNEAIVKLERAKWEQDHAKVLVPAATLLE
jgi:hypothetical protein